MKKLRYATYLVHSDDDYVAAARDKSRHHISEVDLNFPKEYPSIVTFMETKYPNEAPSHKLPVSLILNEVGHAPERVHGMAAALQTLLSALQGWELSEAAMIAITNAAEALENFQRAQ